MLSCKNRCHGTRFLIDAGTYTPARTYVYVDDVYACACVHIYDDVCMCVCDVQVVGTRI